MINENYKYSELTGKIIGCAMEVHRTLGNGFQEKIYQKALEIGIKEKGINYAVELDMPIHYKSEVIGIRRADFLVENTVLIELKAVTQLEDMHLAQAINYLEAYGLEVGLLINSKNTHHQ